jgi:hypothetical protein
MPATLALMTAVASQAVGQVPSGTKVGTLNCELAPSVGFLVGSHQPMRCRYTPEGPFPPEFYEGVINTIGLDIGFTTGGVMTWAVVAPTVGPPRGGLAGLYVGASGDVTVGTGVGANVLFGGSGRSIALQPLSVQGQTGLDLTLGVSGLELRQVRWRGKWPCLRRHCRDISEDHIGSPLFVIIASARQCSDGGKDFYGEYIVVSPQSWW